MGRSRIKDKAGMGVAQETAASPHVLMSEQILLSEEEDSNESEKEEKNQME